MVFGIRAQSNDNQSLVKPRFTLTCSVKCKTFGWERICAQGCSLWVKSWISFFKTSVTKERKGEEGSGRRGKYICNCLLMDII